MENILKYAELILAVLGVFSIIAKMTPNTTDDKVLEYILKIVNALGLTKKED